MKQRVVLVRHGQGPEDDRVVLHLARAGYAADTRRPFEGEHLGDVAGDLAGTVIFGGMQDAAATGRYPFLNEEYRWIGAVLEAGLPLLAICQGAQMLARHQGAWTGARPGGTEEFGYYEIRPEPAGREFLPAPLHVAQAHFHEFDLPPGAVHLASGAGCANQAFRLGRCAYGLQFHAEVTNAGFRRWQAARRGSPPRPGAQSEAVQTALMHRHDAAQGAWFDGFLETLFPAGRAA